MILELHFTRDWRAVCLFFACWFLLLALGAWQLARGLHKQDVERAWNARAAVAQPVARAPQIAAGEYRYLALHGEWKPQKQFLLANRVHKNQLGYEVLTAFAPHASPREFILVNRGWIAKHELARAPQKLTDSLATSRARIQCILHAPQRGFTLGEISADANWPRVIQFVDWQELSAAIKNKIANSLCVLDEDERAAFARVWRYNVMPALRHFGYAAQWWALALTLGVFGLIWRRKK